MFDGRFSRSVLFCYRVVRRYSSYDSLKSKTSELITLLCLSVVEGLLKRSFREVHDATFKIQKIWQELVTVIYDVLHVHHDVFAFPFCLRHEKTGPWTMSGGTFINPPHLNASQSNYVLFVRDIFRLPYLKDRIVLSCHSWTTSFLLQGRTKNVQWKIHENPRRQISKSRAVVEFEIFDSDTGIPGYGQILCTKSSLHKNKERRSHQYSISHVADTFTFDFFMSCSIDASLRMSHFVHTFRKYIRSRIHVLQVFSYSYSRLYIYRSKKVGSRARTRYRKNDVLTSVLEMILSKNNHLSS